MEEDARVGTTFGRYRIERVLGQGGFGTVYLAEDTNPHLRRRVALKVLKRELAADQGFRERFLRESLMAIELDHHPSIVPVYDAGEEGDTLFIAMRHVEGTDLLTTIQQQGALAPEDAASIVSQVGGALDVAHATGLVHRDVKPGNILLSSDRKRAYLADFGLTKRLSAESGLTQAGQFLGTFYYAAPEQIEGKEVDGRADLYALGCVLYECLTGTPPFTGEMSTIIAAHLTQPPPAASAARTGLSPALDGVIARAMAKSPDDRYQSGADLAAAASRALSQAGATVVGTGQTLLPPPPPSEVGEPLAPPPPVSVPPGTPPPVTPPPGAWTPPPTPVPARKRRPRVLLLLGGIGVVAAAIVAVVVLASGGDGGGGGDGAFPTREERLLLDDVTGGFRASCARNEAPPDAEGVLASVTCDSPGEGAEEAIFTRFESRQQLRSFYDGEVGGIGVESDADDCATIATAEHGYTTENNTAGRVLCYRDSGTAFLTWTDDEFRVVGTATAGGEDDIALYTWWAGDLERNDLLDALLGHVPSPISETCDEDEPNFGAGALATVTCDPESGADRVFYTLYDSAESMTEDYDAILDNLGIARDSGVGCATGPPSENPYDSNDEEAGRSVCFVDDDGSVRILWTDDEVLVISEGLRNDGDYPALHGWWESEPGPV